MFRSVLNNFLLDLVLLLQPSKPLQIFCLEGLVWKNIIYHYKNRFPSILFACLLQQTSLAFRNMSTTIDPISFSSSFCSDKMIFCPVGGIAIYKSEEIKRNGCNTIFGHLAEKIGIISLDPIDKKKNKVSIYRASSELFVLSPPTLSPKLFHKGTKMNG